MFQTKSMVKRISGKILLKRIIGKIKSKQKVAKKGRKKPPTLLRLGDVCISNTDRKSCLISVREKQRLFRRKDRTFLLSF